MVYAKNNILKGKWHLAASPYAQGFCGAKSKGKVTWPNYGPLDDASVGPGDICQQCREAVDKPAQDGTNALLKEFEDALRAVKHQTEFFPITRDARAEKEVR